MKTKKAKSSLIFDRVYDGVITNLFTRISDKRRDNSSYTLIDALKSGFAMYALKSPSLFSFRKRSQAEEGNLLNIFGITKLPSDNGLRKILDGVLPADLRRVFHSLFTWVGDNGYLNKFRYWNKYLIVSIDGVEHFCSKKVSCPYCMKRKHRDGSTSHYHSLLSAAIVNPDQAEVLILDNEPIVKQDGLKKNDCEINAVKRLLESIQSLYNEEFMVFVMDALYSCGPIIRQLSRHEKWKYVIGVTDAGHKALFRQFDELNEQGLVHWQDFDAKDGHYTLGYVNGLTLNESCDDVKCNFLYCIWRNRAGKETIFSWVTNIKLSKRNVMKVMRMGRSRWKIENEVFNTLKNQEYHFEHNFGHGEKHLCTNFAFLMMMAFTVDQIQQHACNYFREILSDLKTRIKLWESIRAVFKIVPCKNMQELYLSIANMYQIRLE